MDLSRLSFSTSSDPPHVFSFFFFIIRPPPTSTLFPYTTLFRSRPRLPGPLPAGRQPHAPRRHLPGGAGRRHRLRGRDRKSTRLNSSHRCTSYAVFCLKKKKKLIRTISKLEDMKIQSTSKSCRHL